MLVFCLTIYLFLSTLIYMRLKAKFNHVYIISQLFEEKCR